MIKQGEKLRDADKISVNNPLIATDQTLRKPAWLRARIPATPRISEIKTILRKHRLASVCEEAACPNLGECFGNGTATFMIMGEICTRRCPFCDVAHGRPLPLDPQEPLNLALAIAEMKLRYVVITSVDRDDIRDGGASHFADCIRVVREHIPSIRIEVLVPDFRGRIERALDSLVRSPADVFNHNLETVPRLYPTARPGAGYEHSLELLAAYKTRLPESLTKSGLMVGLGETIEEIQAVMRDMRAHDVDMVTIGQYLPPSKSHFPLHRYVHPDEFLALQHYGESIGFVSVASGPLVRSSYHADQYALAIEA